MDRSSLVNDYLDAGEALVKALDHENMEVEAAFWRYVPESDTYHLVIETPLVDRNGRARTYKAIQDILDRTKSAISLGRIAVVGRKDPTAASLRKNLRVDGIGRVRIS